MKAQRRVVASIVAAGVLVASSADVVAQLTDEWAAVLREAFGDNTILRVTPVLDAPFTADVFTVWHPKPNSGRSEWRATARYHRDRSGRVRVEQMFIGSHSPQRGILATNLNTTPVYVLDHVARTAAKTSPMYAFMTVGHANDVIMPISSSCFIGFIRPQGMNPTLERNGQAKLVIEEEPLGRQTMAGVQVTGTRFTTTVPAGIWGRRYDVQLTYERWVSSELQLEVSGRTEDSEGEVVERRLMNVSRTEPPAGLFEVPAGYHVTSGGPDTLWLNPLVPEIWPAGASPAERCAKPWP